MTLNHERFLNIILGGCIMVAIVSLIAIGILHYRFSSSVSQAKYEHIIELSTQDAEIKPYVEEVLVDNKITGQEYQHIMNVSNELKRRRLLEGFRQ